MDDPEVGEVTHAPTFVVSPNNVASCAGMNVTPYALLYLNKGLSVIPLLPREKRPAIPWKEYQSRLPTEEEVKEWFSKDRNIGIVCGRVSGNLVVIDFDSVELFDEWYKRIDSEYPELRDVVMSTWIVETGKGIHVYLRLSDPSLVPSTKVKVEGKPIDIKGEGGYVVAPPSIHPSGKEYKFRLGPNIDIAVIEPNTWRVLLNSLGFYDERKTEATPTTTAFRALNDNELLEIKELLKEAWIKGQRQYLALFLSGWLAKARVHPVSVAKLFKIIAMERGDNELEERLSTIYYSYRKAYGNIEELNELDKIIEEWKNEGILRRSVSKAISKELEERIKGKSGVQEILESSLGEERALEIIRRIEELIGYASPFRDSIIEILDYDKQLYAVCNLRKLVIVRARREEGRLKYKERVTIGAPTKVTVYINPLGGLTKYEVLWEMATRPKPISIGPAPIEDVVDRLKAEGLVVNHRLVKDVVNAVIEGFIRRGRAEIKEEIESPGFYFLDGKIIAVRWEPDEVKKEELKQALELLNELADNWFKHAVDRFATVIKWGIIAPFDYALKQKGKWIPWLYLYGSTHTGKTTLGAIILAIWGLDSRHRKSGSSVDTVPRLGYVLSQSTFPILVNEPGNAIYKEDIIEVMKSAIESTLARGKYVRGTYTEIPALAPLIMTSNKVLPRDDALLRRLMVLRFTYGEKISPDKAKEFDMNVKPRLEKLKVLGAWVSQQILSNPDLLLRLEPMELAKELLTKAYEEADMEIPAWVGLAHKADDNIYEDTKEVIRSYLIKRINDEYNRFVGKIVVELGNSYDYRNRQDVDFEERVEIVLRKRLLPWAIMKEDEEPYVIFTTDFYREIKHLIGDIGGLKSIAELLGWNYGVFKVGKKSVRGALVKLREFIEFLL